MQYKYHLYVHTYVPHRLIYTYVLLYTIVVKYGYYNIYVFKESNGRQYVPPRGGIIYRVGKFKL
jgi:hypothetical protein